MTKILFTSAPYEMGIQEFICGHFTILTAQLSILKKYNIAVELKKRAFTVTEFVKEDMSGNVTAFFSYKDPELRGIVPNSASELFYKLGMLYHETHNSRGSV